MSPSRGGVIKVTEDMEFDDEKVLSPKSEMFKRVTTPAGSSMKVLQVFLFISIHVSVPPLVLLWPVRRDVWSRQNTATSAGDEMYEFFHDNSFVRPVSAVVLILLTSFRFSTIPDLYANGEPDLILFTYFLPHGSGWLISVFWLAVLLILVAASYPSRSDSKHHKYFTNVLVPEVVALFCFMVADFALDVFKIIDDQDATHPIWGPCDTVFSELRRRWFLGNFAMLLSITIVDKITPPPGTVRAVAFDLGWLAILVQGCSLFLHHSMTRHEDLQRWQSTHFAVVYGIALYFFTHSVVLIFAVIFRRHLGGERVPDFRTVMRHLLRRDPVMNVIFGFCFFALLYFATAIPALADLDLVEDAATQMHHPLHRHGVKGWLLHHPLQRHGVHKPEYARWLRAISQGLCAGPWETLVLMFINSAALYAVLHCCWRSPRRAAHPSWEADLTFATGCFAILVWWQSLNPADGDQWWQVGGRRVAAVAHVAMVAFSSDVFSGHLLPNAMESAAAVFWAAYQVVQGLATEHHAAMHRSGDGIQISELFTHIGEFALCEFGLITFLGWITYIAEHICHNPDQRRSSFRVASNPSMVDFAQPLLANHTRKGNRMGSK